jgi:tetratricopeptide (TPR) repeat protein
MSLVSRQSGYANFEGDKGMDMIKQGNRRTLLLGGLLLAVATLAASKVWQPPAATPASDQGHPTASSAFDAFMTQVQAASKIADPIERCLHMPDPPGSHWHADAVAAYCRYRLTEMKDIAGFRSLIAAGKGAEVDRILAGYLQMQMHDARYPAIFDQAINRAGFDDADPDMRAAIDAWMHQRPDSVFAVAASGMQYQRAAFAARGADLASKTREEQWRAAEQLAEFARRDLDRAAAMSPVVPTIYADMLRMGVLVGDHRYAMAAIERGYAIQPNNFVLRLDQASFTGRKWGGSSAWVKRQAEDTATAAEHTPLLWVAASHARIQAATDGNLTPPADDGYLSLADDVATGHDFSQLAADANRAGKREEAFMLAVEALRFDNSQDDALYVVGNLGSKGYYREWAKAELIRATREHPRSVEVTGSAGVALRRLHEPALAEPLLVYATEHGADDWVLATLGDFYSHEGRNYAKAGAIADELIQHNPANADGYVIRACVDKDTNSPNRYRSARDFLTRFGNDPDQQGPATEIRAWLAANPEPSTG